jgi:hypothetical protein
MHKTKHKLREFFNTSGKGQIYTDNHRGKIIVRLYKSRVGVVWAQFYDVKKLNLIT